MVLMPYHFQTESSMQWEEKRKAAQMVLQLYGGCRRKGVMKLKRLAEEGILRDR